MKIIAYDIRELGWRMETKVKEFTLLKNADSTLETTFYIGGQPMLNRMLLKVKNYNIDPQTTVVKRQHFLQRCIPNHRCRN